MQVLPSLAILYNSYFLKSNGFKPLLALALFVVLPFVEKHTLTDFADMNWKVVWVEWCAAGVAGVVVVE